MNFPFTNRIEMVKGARCMFDPGGGVRQAKVTDPGGDYGMLD